MWVFLAFIDPPGALFEALRVYILWLAVFSYIWMLLWLFLFCNNKAFLVCYIAVYNSMHKHIWWLLASHLFASCFWIKCSQCNDYCWFITTLGLGNELLIAKLQNPFSAPQGHQNRDFSWGLYSHYLMTTVKSALSTVPQSTPVTCAYSSLEDRLFDLATGRCSFFYPECMSGIESLSADCHSELLSCRSRLKMEKGGSAFIFYRCLWWTWNTCHNCQ